MSARTLKTLQAAERLAIQQMTDEQLDAIIGDDQTDMSQFSDDELQSIIDSSASPALLARIDNKSGI